MGAGRSGIAKTLISSHRYDLPEPAIGALTWNIGAVGRLERTAAVSIAHSAADRSAGAAKQNSSSKPSSVANAALASLSVDDGADSRLDG